MRYFDIWKTQREQANVLPNGLKVLFSGGNSFTLYVWKPKAENPYVKYTFRTDAARTDYLGKVIREYDAHLKYVADRKIETKTAQAQGDLKLCDPGAIFSYSWGYEQTQVEYWQVVKRSGLRLTLAEIACETVDGSQGFMSDRVRPAKDAFLMTCKKCGNTERGYQHFPGLEYDHEYEPEAKTITKLVKFSGETPFLKFDFGTGGLVKVLTFGNAEPLAVGTDHRSWYA